MLGVICRNLKNIGWGKLTRFHFSSCVDAIVRGSGDRSASRNMKMGRHMEKVADELRMELHDRFTQITFIYLRWRLRCLHTVHL
jgi:hypothetical protein